MSLASWEVDKWSELSRLRACDWLLLRSRPPPFGSCRSRGALWVQSGCLGRHRCLLVHKRPGLYHAGQLCRRPIRIVSAYLGLSESAPTLPTGRHQRPSSGSAAGNQRIQLPKYHRTIDAFACPLRSACHPRSPSSATRSPLFHQHPSNYPGPRYAGQPFAQDIRSSRLWRRCCPYSPLLLSSPLLQPPQSWAASTVQATISPTKLITSFPSIST